MSSKTKLILQNELLAKGIYVEDELIADYFTAFKKAPITNAFFGLSWADFVKKELSNRVERFSF